LYGSNETAIAAQIRAPKHGVMPAWLERLGETKVKELAVYIHSLGGGE
ncbi:MAG: cytochrome C oxidase Cbb3, partial [Mesorhizobium sp.]